MQRGDRGEGLGGARSKGATGGGQQQCGLHGLERNAAGAERSGKVAVGAANTSRGAGGVAVQFKEPVDVAQDSLLTRVHPG